MFVKKQAYVVKIVSFILFIFFFLSAFNNFLKKFCTDEIKNFILQIFVRIKLKCLNK